MCEFYLVDLVDSVNYTIFSKSFFMMIEGINHPDMCLFDSLEGYAFRVR